MFTAGYAVLVTVTLIFSVFFMVGLLMLEKMVHFVIQAVDLMQS